MGSRPTLPSRVKIVEVGPRDGLQNEAAQIPTDDKVTLIGRLVEAGLPHIEVTSFVSPRWIPQLADARELVPNRRGLEDALAAGLRDVAVFLSASETHNKKNVNKTIADTLKAFEEVIGPALAAGGRVRGYVSTVFGCPYEGPVDPAKVRELVAELLRMGVHEVSLGDTIGVADPWQVREVLALLLADLPAPRLAMHFHDTHGTALANVVAGLEMGLAVVDSSLGGAGGCPYAPGASGNLATEDVVYTLARMGVETGVDLGKLVATSEWLEARLGHDLPSKVLKAEKGARLRAASRAAAPAG
jgi:hydroxymethylglutaryl-CoA lyase